MLQLLPGMQPTTMPAVPAACPVTSPAVLTVAAATGFEDQVSVGRVARVAPVVSTAVGVICTVCPAPLRVMGGVEVAGGATVICAIGHSTNVAGELLTVAMVLAIATTFVVPGNLAVTVVGSDPPVFPNVVSGAAEATRPFTTCQLMLPMLPVMSVSVPFTLAFAMALKLTVPACVTHTGAGEGSATTSRLVICKWMEATTTLLVMLPALAVMLD